MRKINQWNLFFFSMFCIFEACSYYGLVMITYMFDASFNTNMPMGFRIMTLIMIISGALILIGINIKMSPEFIFERGQ